MKLQHSPDIWRQPDSNSRPPWNLFMIRYMFEGEQGDREKQALPFLGPELCIFEKESILCKVNDSLSVT